MVTYKVNGIDDDAIGFRTPHGFDLGRFKEPHIQFRIAEPGTKPVIKTIDVKKTIGDALDFIDSNCAANKKCNEYFTRLQKGGGISLRKILEEKTLYIYRLVAQAGVSEEELPEGFTFSLPQDKDARIGLRENVLARLDDVKTTLLHELAHVAGAPGRAEDPKSNAAETALKHCGMKEYFDPEALGRIDRRPGQGHSQRRPV